MLVTQKKLDFIKEKLTIHNIHNKTILYFDYLFSSSFKRDNKFKTLLYFLSGLEFIYSMS